MAVAALRLTACRPWDTRDRAPSALPERRHPKLKWWDRAAIAVLTALKPRITDTGSADRRFAARVVRAGRRLDRLSDDDLRATAASLRPRLLAEGFDGPAAVRAFALTREATRRALGYRHHPVQIMGARRILSGHLTEMATGEGKTATTALAAATAALAGVPVHVVTVNEYLCTRDHDTLLPVYALLGLGSAAIDPEADPAVKRRAWLAPIVHVSGKTLVFEYLRERLGRDDLASPQRRAAARLAGAGARPSMPPALAFAIVDEVDSVLIDEAQTPLIIAAPHRRMSDADCHIALAAARVMTAPEHFRIRRDARRVELTDAGHAALARATEGNGGLWRVPRARAELAGHALSALHLYERDQHYIVTDGKVQIVDEFTGRILGDRQWQAGLHQMVEVKEGLDLSEERRTLAQITYQEFFRRYLWFGGMSGTLAEVARELSRTYDRPLARVPTNRRVRRRLTGTRLYRTERAKIAAIVARARRMSDRGRPVLIGTRSVDVSERIAAALAGTPCRLLNARQDAEEAAIVAEAGHAGRITIATNMAGRGTDIKLTPEARAAGGLHVILTEFHESRRIDRQLMGRAGRQGDPGSCEQIVAVTDPVLTRFAPGLCRAARLIPWPLPRRLPGPCASAIRVVAQARAERRGAQTRMASLRRSEKLAELMAFTGRR
ncbi:translocase [Oceanicola sp. 22II-s10i]|uniref:preprotein translocase subunit SecA n=1 Tax=Oceanicola sp. 22II-s10i TaxID=1317116 RepID=UPI000B522783|nr:translocase [Oceanicola sp. 22II-s10i]